MAASSTEAILQCENLNLPDSRWQVEVDCVTSAEWSQMLDLFADANFYQTWSYGKIRWGEQNVSHLVLKRTGEVVGLAQLRIVQPTRFKFGMAYLRWGPLWERRGMAPDPHIARRMARVLENEYVSKRKLFLRVLPNAFTGSPRALSVQAAFRRFASEATAADNTYRTFLLDLSPPLEDLRKGLDKKWRNLLTSSEKKGLKVARGTGIEEYEKFRSIYQQMRKRKSFETTVDIEEFGRIQEDLLLSHRMQVFLCTDTQDVPLAGLVASVVGDTAIYLLGATSDEGLTSRGAYLLQWAVIKWLKENGYRWYDLGGIDPEHNPGVYHFKRGLSGADVVQMLPRIACNSIMSSALVRATLAMRDSVRSCRKIFHPSGAMSQQPSGS